MFYLVKTPSWLRSLYPAAEWKVETQEKELFLTFDDGPHPMATSFVLDQLKQFNAKASFFCVGNNVKAHPEIYQRMLDEGHTPGNHTYDHLNGWKTESKTYLQNITLAQQYIDSHFFRPPYGRIKKFQAKLVREQLKMKLVMWDVLSGDFDVTLSPQRCFDHVALNANPGSIIVFHDSEKAWPRLEYALPKVLEYFTKEGYVFKSLLLRD